MKKLIILILLCLISFISCKEEISLEEEVQLALEKESIFDTLNELLKLDQQINNSPKIKLNIGTIYLQQGEMEKSGIYLSEAEKLISGFFRKKDKELEYIIYSNLAEYHFRQKNFDESVKNADKAIKIISDDNVNSQLTKAKALAESEKSEESRVIFDDYYINKKSAFNKEDYIYYVQLLITLKLYDEALPVINEFESKYGLDSGIGLYQSVIFENLGKYNESFIAILKELDFQRYYGSVGEKQIVSNLREVESKIILKDEVDSIEINSIINGIVAYINSDWQLADQLLGQFYSSISLDYFNYIELVINMQISSIIDKSFAEYISYEPVYSSHPGFYFYLWKGMKNGEEGDYSFNTAQTVIEKSILLAPNTKYANESRIELGRLLGLNKNDSEKILLFPEIELIYRKATLNGTPEVIEPLIAMLGIKDNLYSAASLITLQKLSVYKPIKEYVSNNLDRYSSNIILKLKPLLGDIDL